MAELEDINKSGELTEINLGGSDASKAVLTKEQILQMFGNWKFSGDSLKHFTATVLSRDGSTGKTLGIANDTEITSVLFPSLTVSLIDTAPSTSAVTKEWVEQLFGAWALSAPYIKIDGRNVILAASAYTRLYSHDQNSYLEVDDYSAKLRASDGVGSQQTLSVVELGIFADWLTTEMIDNATNNVILTKQWANDRLRANNLKVGTASATGSVIQSNLSDNGRYMIKYGNGDYTYPLPNTTDYEIGFSFLFEMALIGSVTFSGININSADGLVMTKAYNVVRLVRTTLDSWTISGIRV